MSRRKKNWGDWRELCIILLNALTLGALALFMGLGWLLCRIFGG